MLAFGDHLAFTVPGWLVGGALGLMAALGLALWVMFLGASFMCWRRGHEFKEVSRGATKEVRCRFCVVELNPRKHSRAKDRVL